MSRASDKAMHTHFYTGSRDDREDYSHDHRLFTRSQLLLHLRMQHQPRQLPTIRFWNGRWERGVLDLDAGR